MKKILPGQEVTISSVREELAHQLNKWGVQNHHPQMWMNILMEEVGEASQAMMEAHFRDGKESNYRDELIQVAAVAISAVECFDRLKYAEKT